MSQFMDMVRLPNYGLGVAKGQFDDITHIHKFGAVPTMSINTTGTIWDINDTLYPWSTVDAGASTLTVDCASASDVGEQVVVIGLDGDWNVAQETVSLSSQTGNATTTAFRRVYRAYFIDGAAAINVGNIDIKYSTTVIARISANKGQTQMSVYTTPANTTGYVVQLVGTIQSGGDATIDMFVRYFGEDNFRSQHTFEVAGVGGQYMMPFTVPLNIPPKSDIDCRARVRSNNSRVTAVFEVVLDED